jgi:hypothetical protein
MKPKTLIIYEDKVSDLAKAAEDLNRLAEGAGVSVRVRTASSVTVAEVLAADLLLIGAKTQEASSYSELRRLFRGINLAGRRAAFFRPRETAGVESMKRSMNDTDITFYVPDLDINSSSEAPAAWIKAVMDL